MRAHVSLIVNHWGWNIGTLRNKNIQISGANVRRYCFINMSFCSLQLIGGFARSEPRGSQRCPQLLTEFDELQTVCYRSARQDLRY